VLLEWLESSRERLGGRGSQGCGIEQNKKKKEGDGGKEEIKPEGKNLKKGQERS